MSTITGLISAGGGGGGATNIVTDVNLLTRVIVQQSLVELRYSSVLYNPGETNFYGNPFNFDYTYQAEATTADTYVTLADITSSSNGGYLHVLVTPATIDTQSTTIKFTVDGTATEITYANGSGLTSEVVGIFGGTIPNPQGSIDQSPFNTADLSHQAGAIWTREDATNKWYAGSNFNLICQPWLSQALNLPRLRFESTLKIEIKKSAIAATVEDNKASAFITLQ